MKLMNSKTFSWFVGIFFLMVGLVGYAFRGSIKMPDSYLLVALVIGFLGILVSFENRS
jgi:hypothetical protein